MLAPNNDDDSFYVPLPKNPNLLVKKKNKKRPIENVGVKLTPQEQQRKAQIEKELADIERSQQLQPMSKESRDKQKKLQDELKRLRIKETTIIPESEEETSVVNQNKAVETPRQEIKEEEIIKKPKLEEGGEVKEIEDFLEPILRDALEPFYQFINMLDAESGKNTYYRYVKDLSYEQKQIPIVWGCKTKTEFYQKNRHLGQALISALKGKFDKKLVGAPILSRDTPPAPPNYKEIIDNAFNFIPEQDRPQWVQSLITDSVFHFLLQNSTFGALQLAANELKFPLKDLIFSPHVNFKFAQFCAVKFIKPKSNAYASGIQGGDMQFRISSGVLTGQQYSKWLLGCNEWFKEVVYRDNSIAKNEKLNELTNEMTRLAISAGQWEVQIQNFVREILDNLPSAVMGLPQDLEDKLQNEEELTALEIQQFLDNFRLDYETDEDVNRRNWYKNFKRVVSEKTKTLFMHSNLNYEYNLVQRDWPERVLYKMETETKPRRRFF